MEPEKSLLKEFLQGGWVVPLIGAGAMLARLLSGENNYTWWQQLKKIFTAGLSAGIAWFILEQTEISSLYKAVTYGIIGVKVWIYKGEIFTREFSQETNKN